MIKGKWVLCPRLSVLISFCCFSCRTISDNLKYNYLYTKTYTSERHVGETIKNKFKIIGYLPAWAGEIKDIQFDKLTHVNYAFVLPTAIGGLSDIENIPKLELLISQAHLKNVKVLVSIGGWNYGNDSAFETLAGNFTSRNNFANNLLNLLTKYNADGIDIDWEAPEVGASANNFSLLMHQLSTALHNKGKLLSAAVSIDHGESIDSSVFNYVDYLNLMAYDARNNTNHSPYSLAVDYLDYWRKRGLTKSKAMLGVPFYGRSTSEYVLYNTILLRGGSPYSDNFGSIGYNGIATIKNKTTLALKEFGGIFIWELSGDSTGNYSLLNAIDEVVENLQ